MRSVRRLCAALDPKNRRLWLCVTITASFFLVVVTRVTDSCPTCLINKILFLVMASKSVERAGWFAMG